MALLKFVVEANIGAGKSSFLSIIRSQKENLISTIYEQTKIHVKIYCEPEPTREWGAYLRQYYSTYSDEDYLRLQLIIYTSLYKREKVLSEKIAASTDKNEVAICFLERDLDSGRNFFFRSELPPKDDHILKVLSWILKSNSWIHREPKNYIYIESDPETCLNRIKSRQTAGDSKIPFSFLVTLNERYQRFFTSRPHVHLMPSDIRTQIHENPASIQSFILPIILGTLRNQNGQQYSKNRGDSK